jgi:hypothetical protein
LSILERGRKGMIRDGKRVLLLGDFNTHVGVGQGNLVKNDGRKDVLGKKLLRKFEEWDVKLLNGSDKCVGLWTRMRGKQKSVIDFVVGDVWWENRLLEMNIDDEGNGVIESDHNLIISRFEMEGGKGKFVEERVKKGNKKGFWKMSGVVDWQKFRKEVEDKIEEGEWLQDELKVDDVDHIEEITKGLGEILYEVGRDVVGMWDTSEGKKAKYWNSFCSEKKEKRKMTCRAWKREVKLKGRKVDERWKDYMKAKEDLKKERFGEKVKENKRFMEEVLRKGGAK